METGYEFRNMSLSRRQLLSQKIRGIYPDRCPVIILMPASIKHLTLTKVKYLAPTDITIAKFLIELKKFCLSNRSGPNELIKSDETIYLSAKDQILPMSTLILSIDTNYRDVDGFVYISVHIENTFG